MVGFGSLADVNNSISLIYNGQNFLKYWKDWGKSITKTYPYLAPAEKEQMQIGQITLEVMTITGIVLFYFYLLLVLILYAAKSFVEMMRFLLKANPDGNNGASVI